MKKRKDQEKLKLNIYTYQILRMMECFLEGRDRIPTANVSLSSLTHLVRNYIDNVEGRFDQTLIDRVPLYVSDHQTLIHSINVMQLSIFLGMNTGLDKTALEKLAIAALLHDIGKIYVPLEIIKKPAKLTEEEFEKMKMHPVMGAGFLKFIYPHISEDIVYGILEHHERMDGSGYPAGTTSISQFGRIIAVADTFEAFTAERPYHKERSLKEGVTFLTENEAFDAFYVNELKYIAENTMLKENMFEEEIAI